MRRANGKQVTALVELRARFDEANNIQWAKRLEESGAHVVYGVVGLKTHCKALLVVRRDPDRLRQHVHLGTGNYHPRTARIYTDFSLFTTAPELTEEVAIVFNTLTGLAGYPGLKAPGCAFRFAPTADRADSARARPRAPGKPARIVAKLNSLVDQEVIEKLYEASCAGVKIDLVISRHLLPASEDSGLSENIRVISIVGRFLEHSRIYYFENGGEADLFSRARIGCRGISIAGWRLHSRSTRRPCGRRSSTKLLPRFLTDYGKARELQPDGSYVRLKPEKGAPRSQAQLQFARFLAGKARNWPRNSALRNCVSPRFAICLTDGGKLISRSVNHRRQRSL